MNLLYKLLCLFFIFNQAFALAEDNKQKVFIVADSSIYNYKTGMNIFIGNVKVDQGTTHITADKLITKNNDAHQIKEAIAYGLKNLAHYSTIAKLGDPIIHARAKIIKFYPIESNATLEQHVIVNQGENNFRGELILYNGEEQTITVPNAKNARAVLVYNPDK